MSEALRWFPFYIDRFLNSRRVRRMDARGVGTYVLLLIEQWDHGPLPDDDGELAFVGRADAASVRAILERCFERTERGWVNHFLEEVRAEQESKVEKKSTAGAAGAKARWDRNAVALPTDANRKEVEVEKKREPHGASLEYRDAFTVVWKLHPRGAKAKALEAYRKSVPAKISHDKLVECLARYVREKIRPDFDGQHLFRWISEERWEEFDRDRPRLHQPSESAEDRRKAALARERAAQAEADRRAKEDAETKREVDALMGWYKALGPHERQPIDEEIQAKIAGISGGPLLPDSFKKGIALSVIRAHHPDKRSNSGPERATFPTGGAAA